MCELRGGVGNSGFARYTCSTSDSASYREIATRPIVLLSCDTAAYLHASDTRHGYALIFRRETWFEYSGGLAGTSVFSSFYRVLSVARAVATSLDCSAAFSSKNTSERKFVLQTIFPVFSTFQRSRISMHHRSRAGAIALGRQRCQQGVDGCRIQHHTRLVHDGAF